MLTYYLLPIAPPVMRFYRNTVLVDVPRLLDFIPERGSLLDVGCGTGLLDYAIAKRRPGLTVSGVDIDERAVTLANRYNRLPNVTYAAQSLSEVNGLFDCISFVDVIHHTLEDEARGLLNLAARLLAPGGRVLIKDIARKGGWFSYAHDRYVTRSRVIRLADPEEMLDLIPAAYELTSLVRKTRFPFPNYYVTLALRSDSGAGAMPESGGT